MSETARPLRVVLGERVRALREAAGLRQQDVADALRALGAPTWTRSRVAGLERGDKAISAEGLILIVAALQRATARSVTLAELLSADDLVALTDSQSIPARRIVSVLNGDVASRPAEDHAERGTRADLRHRLWVLAPEERERAQGRARTLAKILVTSGEAEERAARDLAVTTTDLARVSAQLWGRSLSTERDARVAAMGGDDMNPRSRAAHRGRVTRELTEEARSAFAPADRTTGRD